MGGWQEAHVSFSSVSLTMQDSLRQRRASGVWENIVWPQVNVVIIVRHIFPFLCCLVLVRFLFVDFENIQGVPIETFSNLEFGDF
jgi:hypothetical protein